MSTPAPGLICGVRQATSANSWTAAKPILARLRLLDCLEQTVSEIAYGRQRLVEIAIALSLEPKVLLLDEPAAGVPTGETGLLLEAVDSLPNDIAILMIEHDMQMVRRFATSVSVLVHGRVLMTGPPGEVMASPDVRSVYLGESGHARFVMGASDA